MDFNLQGLVKWGASSTEFDPNDHREDVPHFSLVNLLKSIVKSKLDELDIRVYLELAEKTLNDEEKRATAYLEPSTLRPLVKLCQTNFIGMFLIETFRQ